MLLWLHSINRGLQRVAQYFIVVAEGFTMVAEGCTV